MARAATRDAGSRRVEVSVAPLSRDLGTDLPASTRESLRAGRDARRRVRRTVCGEWTPAADRPDPVSVLQAQDAIRVPDLVPIRYGRMLASPFAFFRGAAAVMAWDLGHAPSTNLLVQCCGDTHLSNFGFFAAPDRRLVFDVNDFDETLRAPFEWDVKRLAASFVVAGCEGGLPMTAQRALAVAVARAYRDWMARFARMRHLDVWYTRVAADDLLATLQRSAARRRAGRVVAKAEQRTNLGALGRFAHRTSDGWRIMDDPPLIVHPTLPNVADPESAVRPLSTQYLRTLPSDRSTLLTRYRLLDAARKVVGVGSVGTETYIALLMGARDDDPLFLQVKQATTSVLAPYAGAASTLDNQGQRVVEGQRLMQATGDPFLGWLAGPRTGDPDFYVRQLRDMKGSVDTAALHPDDLRGYAQLCGGVLARAHARSGNPAEIAGYLGQSETFDRAIVRYATAYADQTEKDWRALSDAVRARRVTAVSGV
jgi:uncharacterized protein (DUF2252 family)